jgi:hypothetical protein
MRGEPYRRIIADQRLGISVLVTFAILSTGCPSTVRPVDTSQRILVEVAEATADVDSAVAEHMPAAQDRAREAVMQEVRAARACEGEECPEVPSEERAVEMYQERLTPWNRTVSALVAFRGVLQTWEQANDAWRESGDRPDNWGALVCEPVETFGATILELLDEIDVPVSDVWRTVVGHAETVCRLGVAVAETVTSSEEGGDE